MNTEKILSEMSLGEKIAFCTGADFWHTKALPQHGVPAMMMADGPHGLRCQKGDGDMLGVNKSLPATCFPTAVTAGATWNRELYAATLDGQVQYFYGKNYSLSLYSNSGGHIYCPDGSYRFTWDYSGTEGGYYCFTATFVDKTTAEIYYNADSSGSMYDTVAFRFESGNIWVFH